MPPPYLVRGHQRLHHDIVHLAQHGAEVGALALVAAAQRREGPLGAVAVGGGVRVGHERRVVAVHAEEEEEEGKCGSGSACMNAALWRFTLRKRRRRESAVVGQHA